ncbi:MAG: hypothetical protein V1740_01365 [Candidatus Woesearchaeota archaeon]
MADNTDISGVIELDENSLYDLPLDLLELAVIHFLKSEGDKRKSAYLAAIGTPEEQRYLADYRIFNEYRNALAINWFERADQKASKDSLPAACSVYARRRELLRNAKLIER